VDRSAGGAPAFGVLVGLPVATEQEPTLRPVAGPWNLKGSPWSSRDALRATPAPTQPPGRRLSQTQQREPGLPLCQADGAACRSGRRAAAPRPQQASGDHARSCERTIICDGGSLDRVGYSFGARALVSRVLTRGCTIVVRCVSDRGSSKTPPLASWRRHPSSILACPRRVRSTAASRSSLV
jgi:hypothetical protein